VTSSEPEAQPKGESEFYSASPETERTREASERSGNGTKGERTEKNSLTENTEGTEKREEDVSHRACHAKGMDSQRLTELATPMARRRGRGKSGLRRRTNGSILHLDMGC